MLKKRLSGKGGGPRLLESSHQMMKNPANMIKEPESSPLPLSRRSSGNWSDHPNALMSPHQLIPEENHHQFPQQYGSSPSLSLFQAKDDNNGHSGLDSSFTFKSPEMPRKFWDKETEEHYLLPGSPMGFSPYRSGEQIISNRNRSSSIASVDSHEICRSSELESGNLGKFPEIS